MVYMFILPHFPEKCNICRQKGSTPKIVMILWSIIYSTILLTTSLDERGSPAARAAAPEGLLPGYQPTTLKLIVNRLSRHKVSTFAFTILAVEPTGIAYFAGKCFGIVKIPQTVENALMIWYNRYNGTFGGVLCSEYLL